MSAINAINWNTLADLVQWFLIGYLLFRTEKKPRKPPNLGSVAVKREYH